MDLIIGILSTLNALDSVMIVEAKPSIIYSCPYGKIPQIESELIRCLKANTTYQYQTDSTKEAKRSGYHAPQGYKMEVNSNLTFQAVPNN